MKTGPGMWVMILGILGIIIGGSMYAANWHHTIGEYGLILGVFLLIIGAAWWMMMNRKGPTTTATQPAQPAKTP